MIVFESRAYGSPLQFAAVDEAIKVTQFIRNKALRYWMDHRGVGKYDLNNLCKTLAAEYPFADHLNSMARQSASERTWSAIARFYDACKKRTKGKKGYPKFRKDVRSVEYKTSGWKLSEDRKSIKFTDGLRIGTLKLKGTRDLFHYQITQFKRVRLVKKADGYYVQFCLDADRREALPAAGKTVGLDVGLTSFYTDSFGHREDNPRFLRTAESALKRLRRRVSKKKPARGTPVSRNVLNAKKRLARKHLKVSRQRKDHATKLARCVIRSHDLVAYEDLQISSMVKNHQLAKSISDASWYAFRVLLESYAKIYGRVVVAVPPQFTSVICSRCGQKVHKTLSTRTHRCPSCGYGADRDENAAINVLQRGLEKLSTAGHAGSYAWGDSASTLSSYATPAQVESLNQESHGL